MTGILGLYVEWLPVCPEVEMGLPILRESMRLVGNAEHPRLVATKSGTDHTEAMITWTQKRAKELTTARMHGFVFKKDSPSSGLFRVRVYNEKGMVVRNGVGMFPREFNRRLPLLPVEEEGRRYDFAREFHRTYFCLLPLDGYASS